MKYTIRPADEEMGNCIPVLSFVILWYAALMQSMLRSFQPAHTLFLLAGLVPLFTLVQCVRRARFYRAQRAHAIAHGRAVHGHITGVAQKMIPYAGKNGSLRFHKYYCLQVKIVNPVTGAADVIESQAYRKPIHCYLASPKVLVYTDKCSLNHYLEGFQWKVHKKDPDIFSYPHEFDATNRNLPILQILFVLIAIGLLIRLMF